MVELDCGVRHTNRQQELNPPALLRNTPVFGAEKVVERCCERRCIAVGVSAAQQVIHRRAERFGQLHELGCLGIAEAAFPARDRARIRCEGAREVFLREPLSLTQLPQAITEFRQAGHNSLRAGTAYKSQVISA